MTLTELPLKDKVTVTQKRLAQRTQGTSAAAASSRAYVLTTLLPPAYRVPAILAPSCAPSAAEEAQYVAFYTFVVAFVYLSPAGRCSESRLETALGQLNASHYALPGREKEKVLRRMEKEGYVLRVREPEPGGEESVDWIVGPRGKVEVGPDGVAGLVRTVFGETDGGVEELEARLEQSLGKGTFQKLKGTREEEDGHRQAGNEGSEEDEDDEGDADGSRHSRRQPQRRNDRSDRARHDKGEDLEDAGDDVDENGAGPSTRRSRRPVDSRSRHLDEKPDE